MNITSIWTRSDPLKKALVTLEDGMEDALKGDLSDQQHGEPDQSDLMDLAADDLTTDSGELVDYVPEAMDEAGDRTTAHAQRRLIAHADFEAAQLRVAEEIGRIGEALANIAAAAHLTRDFATDTFADIHRANDLENGNSAYASENRRLSERVTKLEKLRARYDQLVDVLKRREMKLLAEVETLREQLGDSRLEVVEAHNTIVRGESQQSELRAALAARSGDAERHLRSNESLRERNSALMLELELTQKRLSEMRRKNEELSTLHAGDSAKLAEMMTRIAAEEAENIRVQRVADGLEARLQESNEAVARVSGDLSEHERRHTSEAHALRTEIQSLTSRLADAAAGQGDAASELHALRARISDLDAENRLLEKRNADLRGELDAERQTVGGLDSDDDVSPDMRRRQVEQMRLEMEELRATVARLKRYESLYAAAKGRAAKAKAEASQTIVATKPRITDTPPNGKVLS
ncbi:MAG: hypothetical protein KF914_18585 [Rhizobiaceae bacterium]|nr:hypothetical protein [Rhizobiaceae bacterium]